MPSNLCHPLLLLPSIFPSIRVFSNESVLCIRWPKYWSFSISPSNEYSGLISLRIDWFDLLAVQGTLKSLLQHTLESSSLTPACQHTTGRFPSSLWACFPIWKMGYKSLPGNIAQILGQYGAWHIAGDSGMTSYLSNPLSSSWTNTESSLWVQCSLALKMDEWTSQSRGGRGKNKREEMAATCWGLSRCQL